MDLDAFFHSPWGGGRALRPQDARLVRSHGRLPSGGRRGLGDTWTDDVLLLDVLTRARDVRRVAVRAAFGSFRWRRRRVELLQRQLRHLDVGQGPFVAAELADIVWHHFALEGCLIGRVAVERRYLAGLVGLVVRLPR